MAESIVFFVHGKPQTAGSRSFFGFAKSGKAIIAPANKHQKSWQDAVRIEAKRAFAETPPMECPVTLVTLWSIPRPKSHFRTGKNSKLLRTDAPIACAVEPDEDKLQRALRDALTGVAWKDDALVACCFSCKIYVTATSPGVAVRILRYHCSHGIAVESFLTGPRATGTLSM